MSSKNFAAPAVCLLAFACAGCDQFESPREVPSASQSPEARQPPASPPPVAAPQLPPSKPAPTAPSSAAAWQAELDPQMKAVLDAHASLNPKPIESLTPEEARTQPTIADAAKKVMQERGMPTVPKPGVTTKDQAIEADGRSIPSRVYTPEGEGPFPVTVYAHGGGFVIATIDTYDASCRALAEMANCIVVSIEYRKGPENKFPAAHEDMYAATQWVMNNAAEINGDAARVAVAGESAGGNLATTTCLMAKERGGKMPVHQLLVYPVADNDMNTASYQKYADAKPLNKAAMAWFVEHYTTSPSDAENKMLLPMKATDDELRDLPSATIITAQIDPLMTEGQKYAERLKSAGVEVNYRNFDGVAHEFFGLGAVVDLAKEAQQFAADGLKAAFRGE